MKLQYLSTSSSVSMAEEWFTLNDKNHFWMEWRARVVAKYFSSLFKPENSFLDVGAGNGVFAKQLEKKFGITVDACDLNEKALAQSEISGHCFVYNVYDRSPQMQAKYDVICLMDVMEHLEDDGSFLKAVVHCLKPGGALLINVPSGPCFFSAYDRAAGHFRRYSKKSLVNSLHRAGFEMEATHNWGFFLVLPLLLRKIFVRKGSQEEIIRMGFRSPHPIIENLFLLLMKLELMLSVSTLPGTSLMVSARRKG